MAIFLTDKFKATKPKSSTNKRDVAWKQVFKPESKVPLIKLKNRVGETSDLWGILVSITLFAFLYPLIIN